MRCAILMPTYNEGARLRATLDALRNAAAMVNGVAVYVVDDGSEPPVLAPDMIEPSAHFEVVLARHAMNLGQGAALETARRLALREPSHDVFITMDSDGQHDVADLSALIAAVDGGADVAFGNRFAGDSNVPLQRRLLLSLACLFDYLLTGLWLSDAHNGYRAFSRRGLSAIAIHQNRMAHATEIKQNIAEVRGQLELTEVPVSVRYTTESLAKGQSSLGAINILRDITFRYLFGRD